MTPRQRLISLASTRIGRSYWFLIVASFASKPFIARRQSSKVVRENESRRRDLQGKLRDLSKQRQAYIADAVKRG